MKCAFLKQMILSLIVIALQAYERPIIVVIPSYNNTQWCQNNLKSVFEQKYHNFLVIYIDDCSTDDTYDWVEQMINEHNFQDRIILIHNNQRRGAMENLYNAIVACDDRAIIVTVDGDDWLASCDVLARLNREYENSKVWMTWGQYAEHPTGEIGFSREFNQYEIAHVLYREREMPVSHLRTFYAGLFKKINPNDLKKNGQFYTMAWDKAMMGPMLEMCAGRFKFISDVLYIYNNFNPLNDHRVDVNLQHGLAYEIFSKRKYKPLQQVNFVTKEYLNVYDCCNLFNLQSTFAHDCTINYAIH